MKSYLVGLTLLMSTSALADGAVKSKADSPTFTREVRIVDGEEITVLKKSFPWEKTIEAAAMTGMAQTCEVQIATDYWQDNTVVKVETSVDQAGCNGSSGAYTVIVRTADEEGHKRTQKYEEKWSRNDDETLQTLKEYSMNGDLDLVRVRVKLPIKGSCICNEDAQSNQSEK